MELMPVTTSDMYYSSGFEVAAILIPRIALGTKIMCLPLNKVWSYINMCAAVTAGTWAELR